MEKVATFNAQQLSSIAKILAETDTGLTGTEIGYILKDCGIPDTDPTNTKWKRLFNALDAIQNKVGVGNHIIMFVNRAMNPVQYTGNLQVFTKRRDQLNVVLSFSGLTVGEDGRVRRATQASNLDEALQRATRLHIALVSRGVHTDVLDSCRAEFLQENYFHAVFEATKSIAAKVRRISGLTTDGAALIESAFALGKDCNPLLAINSLATETDKGEQRGFVNLLVGLFGTVRNPLAHNPKMEWTMDEQDALDVLTMASLIHRKLDKAYRFSKER